MSSIDRLAALEARVVALELRLPAPRPVAAPIEEGTRVFRPSRVGPKPSAAEIDEMIAKIRRERPDIAAFQLTDTHGFKSDFASAYQALKPWGREPAVDEAVDGLCWLDRIENWRMDAGLGSESLSGPAFIFAAVACGDIPMKAGRTLRDFRFALSRFSKG
jgi:hypothetical protein